MFITRALNENVNEDMIRDSPIYVVRKGDVVYAIEFDVLFLPYLMFGENGTVKDDALVEWVLENCGYVEKSEYESISEALYDLLYR